MAKWFVVYSLETYLEHPDKIYRPLDPGYPIPKFSNFELIKSGDTIVYYGSGYLLGIFIVKSEMEKGKKNDPFWDEVNTYEIERVSPRTDGLSYFDFKTFYKTAFSTNKEFSPTVLRKNHPNIEAIIKLEDSDYEKIEQGMLSSLYTKKVEVREGNNGPTGFVANQEMISGLLDYYNSRSTSFASLALASIFGLVTLSAIIQTKFDKISLDLSINVSSDFFPLIISFIVLLGFGGACLYTILTYFHYAIVADKIKKHGLEDPFLTELSRIKWHDYNEKKEYEETNLLETLSALTKQHSKLRIIAKREKLLFFLFILIAVSLILFVYWSVISQVIIPTIFNFFQ